MSEEFTGLSLEGFETKISAAILWEGLAIVKKLGISVRVDSLPVAPYLIAARDTLVNRHLLIRIFQRVLFWLYPGERQRRQSLLHYMELIQARELMQALEKEEQGRWRSA